MNQTPATAEMPRYRCHKEVWALKIKGVVRGTPEEQESHRASVLWFEDERYGPRGVTADYIRKHAPQAGGYFVVYKGGYESFSPAEAFEEGYTKV